MSKEISHEAVLRDVLEQVKRNNLQARPGTPMSELKNAIEATLANLPPLKFEEFSKALDDRESAGNLVRRAPEMAGWNADQIVTWVEELSKKI